MEKIYKRFLILFSAICFAGQGFATIIPVTVGASGNLSFSPANVSASVGDTIKWIWQTGSHTTTSTSVPAGAATWDNPINSSSTSFMYKVTVPGTYNYKCTIHSSMGMVGSITVNVLGTPSFVKPVALSLYPNPFSKNLTIDFKTDISAKQPIVEIYDIVGKQYLHTKFYDGNRDGKMSLDLEFLNPGVYFIYIINNGKKDIYKVIRSNDSGAGTSFNMPRENPIG